MDNYEKIICIVALGENNYEYSMYGGFDSDFFIPGEFYNMYFNAGYYYIYAAKGHFKGQRISLFNKEIFDKHFILLAECRQNKIEEILNG